MHRLTVPSLGHWSIIAARLGIGISRGPAFSLGAGATRSVVPGPNCETRRLAARIPTSHVVSRAIWPSETAGCARPRSARRAGIRALGDSSGRRARGEPGSRDSPRVVPTETVAAHPNRTDALMPGTGRLRDDA